MMIGIDVSLHRATKTRKLNFFCFLFSNLIYGAKFPNWAAAGCHGNLLKIRLHGFVCNVLIHHVPKYCEHATFRF